MLVQGLYDLNILIDDLNLFEAEGVAFVRADLYEAIMNPIPVCELEVNVPLTWLDDRSIVDGTLIEFRLKSEILDLNQIYRYRIFNIKEIDANQQFMHLIIQGVIDFFDGYSHPNEHNIYGSSATVFQNIAKQYKLTPVIDSTNDNQLWVSGRNNIYQFLNQTAQYGWVDDTSGMFWCIDRHKFLLYKNLTSLFRQRHENIWTFLQTPQVDIKKKQYNYTNAKASVQSGTNNLKNEGYGGSDTYFDLLSYSWKEAHAKKVVAESALINISKELSKGIAQEWYSFDVGNFHPNYFKAYKQNKRVLSTYSSYVTLECQFFQPYRLGQIVNYQYIDAQDINNKVRFLSGVFMIDAIHISISLTAITSTVELVMQGMNGKPTTREVY